MVIKTTFPTSIVTGAAGFIGSHLVERLLKEEQRVFGVDCFADYYSRTAKEANLGASRNHPRFRLLEIDISSGGWPQIFAELPPIDYVFHLAAQPGVRGSWGRQFDTYVQNNVLGTQALLESLKEKPPQKFVYASSSSIYGQAVGLPISESLTPSPISPYGVTKLAGEHLCHTYDVNFSIPSVCLRYFTVFGPRQRPDMGIHRFAKSIMDGTEISLYGSGYQSRDFTYVSDIVEATLQAALRGPSKEVINVGSGTMIAVRELLLLLEEMIGRAANVTFFEEQEGDVTHTQADITKAHSLLNYRPRVSLADGLAHEIEWLRATAKSQTD